jgi:hypothetical protein
VIVGGVAGEVSGVFSYCRAARDLEGKSGRCVSCKGRGCFKFWNRASAKDLS